MNWTTHMFTVSQYGAYNLVSDVLTQQGFDSLEELWAVMNFEPCLKPINDTELCGLHKTHKGDCMAVDSPECLRA